MKALPLVVFTVIGSAVLPQATLAQDAAHPLQALAREWGADIPLNGNRALRSILDDLQITLDTEQRTLPRLTSPIAQQAAPFRLSAALPCAQRSQSLCAP